MRSACFQVYCSQGVGTLTLLHCLRHTCLLVFRVCFVLDAIAFLRILWPFDSCFEHWPQLDQLVVLSEVALVLLHKRIKHRNKRTDVPTWFLTEKRESYRNRDHDFSRMNKKTERKTKVSLTDEIQNWALEERIKNVCWKRNPRDSKIYACCHIRLAPPSGSFFLEWQVRPITQRFLDKLPIRKQVNHKIQHICVRFVLA